MGKPTGFKEYDREMPDRRSVEQRLEDYNEIYKPFGVDKLVKQAARCMDCGVPTCHAGCPLGNLIPDWNDQIYHGDWLAAYRLLSQTNNFPEFTGRLCPAPCEEACVLAINEPAVTIELIEKEIVEKAFANGWVQPQPPAERSGKEVAVIGSGPAGLACAHQLNRAGHLVTVFERDDRAGGLLRYGIPDFKMEKTILQRRLDLLAAEGIIFKTGVHIGVDLDAQALSAFDAVAICTGATVPRDLPVAGRELDGIHLAVDFLSQQNRRVAGDDLAALGIQSLSARGKDVIVIGGGDTGSDCVGTCLRQKARSVTNFELLPQPPMERPVQQPWPYWPMRMRTSSSHEEGGQRYWSILTKSFEGSRGVLKELLTVEVETIARPGGGFEFKEKEGTQKRWSADMVLLALGFSGPERDTLVAQLQIDLDPLGCIATDDNYMTNIKGVFAAGDARRGQSLIVWAISEGRETARHIDIYLTGASDLPSKGPGDLPRA